MAFGALRILIFVNSSSANTHNCVTHGLCDPEKYFFCLMNYIVSGGSIGWQHTIKPAIVSIVVVTKKKISNKNAMSAIEPAISSGGAPLLVIILYLIIYSIIFLTQTTTYPHLLLFIVKDEEYILIPFLWF